MEISQPLSPSKRTALYCSIYYALVFSQLDHIRDSNADRIGICRPCCMCCVFWDMPNRCTDDRNMTTSTLTQFTDRIRVKWFCYFVFAIFFRWSQSAACRVFIGTYTRTHMRDRKQALARGKVKRLEQTFKIKISKYSSLRCVCPVDKWKFLFANK